jgi:hypothetical protein
MLYKNWEAPELNVWIPQFLAPNGFLRGAAVAFQFFKASVCRGRLLSGRFLHSIFQRISSSSIACETVKVEDPSFRPPLLVHF